MNERVVWLLTFPAPIEAAALLHNVTGPQVIQAQAIGSNGSDHLVMRHRFEASTSVEWVLLGLAHDTAGRWL